MAPSNLSEGIDAQISNAVRRLLSAQDRDPYSPTFGCFDRRHWAWKLADLADATLQCAVQPLAQVWADPRSPYHASPVLRSSVLAGIRRAVRVQHRDGSFDQAFPNEHSFGATAFLLFALFEAFTSIRAGVDDRTRGEIEGALRRAAEFLCAHNEEHGHIANHLAGAALALVSGAEYFGEPRYRRRAEELIGSIVGRQSSEGWFLEYDGADPGYQTLCLYYLAQAYRRAPSDGLRRSLERAVSFLAYFVHPDGTFAGEYGSRRTSVFYPGGLALLGQEFPLARSMVAAMRRAVEAGDTVTLADVDAGNVAPLLANYVLAFGAAAPVPDGPGPPLPCEQGRVNRDFREAGLFVRGTDHYYAVLGGANGGVLKVFDRRRRRALWDDGGYVGQLARGTIVTTQTTIPDRSYGLAQDEITVPSAFYRALRAVPRPRDFLVLRALNLTVMRSIRLGNGLKRLLVRRLVTGKRRYAMHVERRVRFEDGRVVVQDHVSKSPELTIAWLECGRKFVGIHMASARYFEGRQMAERPSPPRIDVDQLNAEQAVDVRIVIDVPHA